MRHSLLMLFVETKLATSGHHIFRNTCSEVPPGRTEFSEVMCKGKNSGAQLFNEETVMEVDVSCRHSPRSSAVRPG